MSAPKPPAKAPHAHCTLEFKTIPNASCTKVVGWLGSAIKLKVQAPPQEGRANDALLEFMAEKLGISRHSIALIRGDKSRQKIIRIDGLDLAEVETRLGLPPLHEPPIGK